MKRNLLFLVFLLFSGLNVVLAQTHMIKGTVTQASDGVSVIGASIVVPGTTIGTVTGIDGTYTLKVPNDAKNIQVSFIGLNTQKINIVGKNQVDIQLESNTQQMDEVVVTAMGIKREKKALSYAVQDVKADKLQKTGNADMAGSLQGKVAGIEITPSSGMPGASSQIQIRGSRSFTGDNTPLYVVDGMPISSTSDFSTGNGVTGSDVANRAMDIDPNDIASINVLKGQAAAALYGIRASNGVIVITTKSGAGLKEGRPKVTISNYTSFEVMSKPLKNQTTYAQGIGGAYTPITSYTWGPKISELPNDPEYGGNSQGHPGMYKVLQLEEAGLDPWVKPDAYNNVKDFFETGVTTTTSANVAQGTKWGTYSIGIGNTHQTGIAPSTYMDRWNGKINAATKLNDYWNSGLSGNFSTSTINKLSGGNDATLLQVYAAPASYNLKGIPYANPQDEFAQIRYRNESFDNPYWAIDHNEFNENTDRFFGNAYLEYSPDIHPDMTLSIKYQAGVDIYTTHFQDIFDYGSQGFEGKIDNYGVTKSTYNGLLTVNYDWKINDNNRLTVLAGNELNHENKKTYTQSGQNFVSKGWKHITNVRSLSADETQFSDRTVGFFGNISYSWRDMLFLNVTGRGDYVSKLPPGNHSFFYPSASVGWIFTELDGMKKFNWLDYGKVRFSFAQVGQAGQYYEDYLYSPSHSTSGFFNYNGSTYPYDGQTSFAPYFITYDPNLKPQNTSSFEVGMELKLFDGRLSLDYTYSRQNVTDQIFNVPLSGSTGFSEVVTNGGRLYTNGHELVGSIQIFRNKNINWAINANYSRIISTVDELKEGVESIMIGGFTQQQVRIEAGATYPVIYGNQFKRNKKGEILVDEDPTSRTYGLPILGAYGKIGEVTPDFTLGFGTNFRYKSWTLDATFDWKSGGQMYHGTYGALANYGVRKDTEDRTTPFVYDGYKADGSKNDIVRGGKNDANAYQTLYNDLYSSIDESFIVDNSFLKLRELSVGYHLPKNLYKSLDINLSVYARNLLLWAAMDYFDPEASQGTSNMSGAFERFSMPQATSYGFGINVTF